MGPACLTVAVKLAGRFANGVFPELVQGRVAPVGGVGFAVAAAPPLPAPELPDIVADCMVRSKTQRMNYWSGTEACSASMRNCYYFVEFICSHTQLP